MYAHMHNMTCACIRWELVLGPEELSGMDLTWLHLPVPDYSAPQLGTIIHGVRFIAEQVCVCVSVCVCVCVCVCV